MVMAGHLRLATGPWLRLIGAGLGIHTVYGAFGLVTDAFGSCGRSRP
jgi:hypothetical protein